MLKSYFGTFPAFTLCIHLMIVIATVVLVMLGYDLFPVNFDTLPMHDWNVPWRRRDWAWTHRDNYTDRYVRKLDQQGVPRWFRHKEYPRGNIVLYYDAGDNNIFTKKNLLKIKHIEENITSMDEYSHYCVQILPLLCMRPASVLRYFDGTFADVDLVFYDPDFTNISAVLSEASTNAKTKDDFAVFLAKHARITPNSALASFTRTIIPLGYPLNADSDIKRMEKTMQEFLVESFKPVVLKLKSEIKHFDLVYWSYLLFKSDLAKQALNDAVLAIGSLLFIYCFIIYHTKSLWISSFGVMSIFISFLAANMIYRIVLDFRYIGFFHIIAIFIILGIGADDVFIFLDVWKNTAYNIYPSLAHRLSDAYRRAVVSMFVTSLTTAIAFFASAFSPLLPARSFGVFAGLLVIVNYISVVLFFPCVVVVHHIYFKNCQWPCFRTLKSSFYCIDHDSAYANNHKAIDAYCNASLPGTYKSSVKNVWTISDYENPSFQTDKEKRANSDSESINSAKESERRYPSQDDVGATDKTLNSNTEGKVNRETNEKKILVRFFRDWYFKFVTHKVCRWIIVTVMIAMAICFTFSAVRLELDNEQVRIKFARQNFFFLITSLNFN